MVATKAGGTHPTGNQIRAEWRIHINFLAIVGKQLKYRVILIKS